MKIKSFQCNSLNISEVGSEYPLNEMVHKSFQILLVEDDPGDVELTRIGLSQLNLDLELAIVDNGEAALAYLHQQGEYANSPRPDLILLDLNLPGLSGREILQEVKQSHNLKLIPVVVLTTSDAEDDILTTYRLGANCFITKSPDLATFMKTIESIEHFWLTTVALPTRLRG